MPRPARRAFRRSRKNRGGFRRKGGFIKTIKRVINHEIESKMINLANEGSPTVVSTSGDLTDFNDGITRGVGATQMIGTRIKMQRLRMTMGIAAGDNTNIFRIVIFYAKKATVLADAQAACVSVYAPWNQEQFPVYILSDKVYTLAASEASGAGAIPSFRMLKYNLNLKHWPATYTDASPAVNQTGYLGMYCISDSGAAVHPNFTYNLRLTFQDA